MLGDRKRGRGRRELMVSAPSSAGEGVFPVRPMVIQDPPVGEAVPLPEHQLARLRLRQRWELASVLHFLRVFRPIIGGRLDFTAEEIETALIAPNHVLAEIHIALLKGIPPVSKNIMNSDAWVTTVCKKIEMWWHWVAEGDIPLIVDHGKEVSRYKELDPTIRLLILKALCEIRSGQYDISRFINGELKRGTELSTFRKDRMGGDGHGIAFWYDGDSILGHRLYRESGYTEFKKQIKERCHIVQPKFHFKWETLATNLEEFRDILDKLSSSAIPFEAAVGKTITNEIIPVLEKLQKRKRAPKKQKKHAEGAHDSFMCYQLCDVRSLRARRTICYTFDEFDRSIEEAIMMNNGIHRVGNDDRVSDDEKVDDDHNSKIDEEGKDYDTDLQNDGGFCDSNKENNNLSQKMPPRNAKEKKDLQPQKVVGLRRSMRAASRCYTNTSDSDMKKALGQWHNHDINYDNAIIVPDSEDDEISLDKNDDAYPLIE